MRILKRYRSRLLVILALTQLAFLLTIPATRAATGLLAHAVLSGRYLGYVLLAPCLLGFGVLCNQRLKALDWRWLEWSPWNVRGNVALLPLQHRWLWAPYGLMLGACMPLLALFEELIFRNGTTDWVKGLLWGALAFGVLHLLSFVTIRMTLYLVLVGAILVQVYMLDGLVAVFVLHASYNLLALALLIAQEHLKHSPALVRWASDKVAAAT